MSHLSLELGDQDYDDLSLALEPVFAAMKPLRAVGYTQGHGRRRARTSAWGLTCAKMRVDFPPGISKEMQRVQFMES